MNDKEEFSKNFEISNRLIIFLRKNNKFDLVENEEDYLKLIERERMLNRFDEEMSKQPEFKNTLIQNIHDKIDEHKTLPKSWRNQKALIAGRKYLEYLQKFKPLEKNSLPQIFNSDLGYTIFIKMREKFNKELNHSETEFFSSVYYYLRNKKHLVIDSPKPLRIYLENSLLLDGKIERFRDRKSLVYDDLLRQTLAELNVKY